MEEKYYCQAAIQNILDHMIPISEDFDVAPQYLYDCDKEAYVKGFKRLREIVIQIFMDMQEHPEEYGLVLTDLNVNHHSQEARDSRSSAFRLMNLLCKLGQAGEIVQGKLIVNPARFKDMDKIKKISKAPLILLKLCQFGFEFTGLKGSNFDKKAKEFVLSYPEESNIIKAIKGYSMSMPEKWNDYEACRFHTVHHILLSDPNLIPANQGVMDFAACLEGQEKVFFQRLHEGLTEDGYFNNKGDCYDIRYFKKEKDRNYAVECRSDNRKLFVGMKLKNMDSYSDYIHTLPEHIKGMLSRNSCGPNCSFQGATSENCKFRVIWHVDGIEYRKCSFEDVFEPLNYNIEDVKYYIRLLVLDK